jgi:hypothetical protein
VFSVTAGLGRVTYTGGYVLPGASPGAGQTALPDDLESAAGRAGGVLVSESG